NILVRYAVKDDLRQAATATEFLKSNTCFLLKTVILELAWVLSSQAGYNLTRSVVTERLRHICGLPTITVEDAFAVSLAIIWYEQGMDFADAVHLASSSSCSGFATMDRRMSAKAAKVAAEYKVMTI
ncbi:MAG: type II toxin-antitoxin system VapC family toxin, partial [Desulfuromonadaceae bacterium]|nr:type II toxin-antitoxin system VapC family toxin [Desulfuromonadaceae bacterium]